jgi:predicted naringenin-chalcone synthase
VSKIISIGTQVPPYPHRQDKVAQFMQRIYACSPSVSRKMRFLYKHCGIDTRYSVVPDYSLPATGWKFYPPTENLEPFPSLEQRMSWYNLHAPGLAIKAIEDCITGMIEPSGITHLVTVSCTGMSAPGLDLQIMETMNLSPCLFRSSVNFMGCYAAIHGLKWADALCKADPDARVLVVCVELCTLHFQREANMDNIASGMLFGDGAAAVLVTPDDDPHAGLRLEKFHSEVALQGKKDMSWELSSTGFRMTLSSYIPDLLEADFAALVNAALGKAGLRVSDIRHWCIHPGGKRILEAITQSLHLAPDQLEHSYSVMQAYGNMSSPTLLFVLKAIQARIRQLKEKGGAEKGGAAAPEYIFGAAFGPGLTMETFIASVV